MKKDWWKKAVVYQIYPKSFQDSNGDGIGDLKGIISRLDYLENLGVTALWLCPVYQSPGVDNGYDISDYYAIDEQFGTMEDMENLINEADKRGIKIIMDLVVNHTSNQHKWFNEALKGKDNPYRDYYVWRDPVDGHAPNDLQSTFGGSAWEYDKNSNQYYLHQFAKEQPDLNWQNPKLRAEIYRMMNYWVEKGIGGFRMDVIDLIGKNPDTMVMANGDDLHRFIQEMHQKVLENKNLMTVGETWGATPEIAKQYSDPARKELSMVFQFEHEQLDQEPGKAKWFTHKIDYLKLKKVLSKWQTKLGNQGWNSLFWSNHDLPRAVSEFGNDQEYRVESAKMLAILLHLMKGTPYIYQGEEIGMTNNYVEDINEINDIESINGYQMLIDQGISKQNALKMINKKGRDNARTPMQWNDSKNAGFTDGAPWISLNPNFELINADEQLKDSNSMYFTYKKLVEYRKTHDVIIKGDYKLLETDDHIYAYVRKLDNQQILVVANLSNEVVKFESKYGKQSPWISNYDLEKIDLNQYKMRPYEAFAVEIK